MMTSMSRLTFIEPLTRKDGIHAEFYCRGGTDVWIIRIMHRARVSLKQVKERRSESIDTFKRT